MTKREIIIQEIEKGGATMDSLKEAADCKYESVMSIFSMLRLMGKCPVKQEDGTYKFVTLEEWEELKAERAANAKTKSSKPKTPEEILKAAEKALARAEKAYSLAKERFEKSPDDHVLDLKCQKAELELALAKINFNEAQDAVTEEAEEAEEVEETENDFDD